jgi:hypothetical protein
MSSSELVANVVGWVATAIMLSGAVLITLWMAGAIYYDLCDGANQARRMGSAILSAVNSKETAMSEDLLPLLNQQT